MKWLLLLYPRPWRDRYEAEFLALLDDLDTRPWSLRIVLDLLLGAVDARLRPQITARSPESVPLASASSRNSIMSHNLTTSRMSSYRVLAITWTAGAMVLIALVAAFNSPLTTRDLLDELSFLPVAIAMTFWLAARKDLTPRGRTIARLSLAVLLVLLPVLIFFPA